MLRLVLTGLVCYVSVVCPTVCGQDCKALPASSQAKIVAYVRVQFGLPKGAIVALSESNLLSGSCIRHLSYSINWPRRRIDLYLSPDQRYFSTQIFDLSSSTPSVAGSQPNLKESEMARLEANAPMRGPKGAQVTIVEFSDFECPFCARLTQTLNRDVLPRDQSVRIVFKYFPLPFHPWAEEAAEMAECAHKQGEGAFWHVHDFIFSHQTTLSSTSLQPEIEAFVHTVPDINQNEFNACVDQHQTRATVLQNVKEGQKIGIQGTPTFFVNGLRIAGAPNAPSVEAAVALAKRQDGRGD